MQSNLPILLIELNLLTLLIELIVDINSLTSLLIEPTNIKYLKQLICVVFWKKLIT